VALAMTPVERAVMASATTNKIFLSKKRSNNHLAAAITVVETAVALAVVPAATANVIEATINRRQRRLLKQRQFLR